MNEEDNDTFYVQLDMNSVVKCIQDSSIRVIRYLATLLDLNRQNKNIALDLLKEHWYDLWD